MNQTTNPYEQNLLEMGYDRQDCKVLSKMFKKKTFPLTMYGKTFQTEAEYLDALHDFLNGNWNEHTFSDW